MHHLAFHSLWSEGQRWSRRSVRKVKWCDIVLPCSTVGIFQSSLSLGKHWSMLTFLFIYIFLIESHLNMCRCPSNVQRSSKRHLHHLNKMMQFIGSRFWIDEKVSLNHITDPPNSTRQVQMLDGHTGNNSTIHKKNRMNFNS